MDLNAMRFFPTSSDRERHHMHPLTDRLHGNAERGRGMVVVETYLYAWGMTTNKVRQAVPPFARAETDIIAYWLSHEP